MADNTFSFNNDVSIKVHTYPDVFTTRYADLIKHLKDEKPMLVLNGEFVAYETDDSGWHQADKKYAVEPVADVAFAKQDGEHIICRVEADDAQLMHAIACAGMMSTLIFSYEVKADRSKKFFYLTFRETM